MPPTVMAGVDIGGTKVLAVLVDEAGRVLRAARGDTPGLDASADETEASIAAVLDEVSGDTEVAGVGVAAAGFVDAAGERVAFAPHLPWRGEEVRARLEARIGLPVSLDNDANCAALAECTWGAARDRSSALVVTLGTGIGGALVVDGKVWRGAHGMAGEFGHMQLVPDGLPCECGGRGCWEQYCSGRALTRLAGEGAAAYARVGGWLGRGLAGLVAAFDPEVVVLGGGASEAGDLLLEPARRVLGEMVVGAAYRSLPDLVLAELGPRAGAIGAALLARNDQT